MAVCFPSPNCIIGLIGIAVLGNRICDVTSCRAEIPVIDGRDPQQKDQRR